MKQRRTSLKDLAAQLGVSIATVSRALRNSHEVGEEMTKKVKNLAKELNYRPNPFAQSLRKEAPRVIGVIVPNLVTHYYAAVLDGIEDYATKHGYSVISANSHEDYEREVMALDNFLNMLLFGRQVLSGGRKWRCGSAGSHAAPHRNRFETYRIHRRS